MDVYDIGGVRVDRRALLRLAALGIVVPGAASACAFSGGSTTTKKATGTKTAKNPLGVKPDAPAEFFNFEGGYGKDWPKTTIGLYEKEFPMAKVKLSGGQQIQQLLQPRFVEGDPPDVCSSGGLDIGALFTQKQLTPLQPMLDAPAFDTPGKTVQETLAPVAAKAGVYGGKIYGQAYVYVIFGIWFSQPLMDKHGWTYPKTWDEMLALCPKIKKAGIAPWAYQGKYPGYVVTPIVDMAQKAAGAAVGVAVDNLQPNAWRNPALIAAADKFHEIAAKGYFLPGTSGLSHTQAQAYWAQGKAAFIPCGSWLENELGTIAPKDFGMTVKPTPSMAAGDKIPFEGIQVSVGGDYIVPSHGKNPQGGLELLRLMLSKQAAKKFSVGSKELTVVTGYADDLTISTAFQSRRKAIAAAGANTLSGWQYSTWYPKMSADIETATGALLTLEIGADEWSRRCQKVADATAKDSTITKFHR